MNYPAEQVTKMRRLAEEGDEEARRWLKEYRELAGKVKRHKQLYKRLPW